ncbi:hypothetical protein PTKIN_Ptkin07bG0060300 [Pterospermum kingtungense]
MSIWIRAQKLLGIHDILEKHRNVIRKQKVDVVELKVFIFNQLKKRTENTDYLWNTESCKKLLNYRADCVLGELQCLHQLRWSTVEVEFDHSILLWHIATDLSYHDDINKRSDDFDRRETQIAWESLPESGDKESLLVSGCKLAYQLQNLKPSNQESWECKDKWEMMNKVWVELLTYAAGHCEWKEHGQQLRTGGELLTHVGLLMASFALSEQYQDWDLFVTQKPSLRDISLTSLRIFEFKVRK